MALDQSCFQLRYRDAHIAAQRSGSISLRTAMLFLPRLRFGKLLRLPLRTIGKCCVYGFRLIKQPRRKPFCNIAGSGRDLGSDLGG